MKRYLGLFVLAFVFVGVTGVRALTSADKSSIIIQFKRFGWTGINAGWDADDMLISAKQTLDYPLHSTNRIHGGGDQWILPPERDENWGEQTNNQWVNNDKITPQAASDGVDGDLQELWVTWDKTWLYVAVKGEMENSYNNGSTSSVQGNNIMIMFDRNSRLGVVNFTDGVGPNKDWKKGIYTRGFVTDLFLGFYGGWNPGTHNRIGGMQYWAASDYADPTGFVEIGEKNLIDSTFKGATNDFDAFYNGDYESDPLQRVLISKVRISSLTNGLTNTANINLKLLVLTVDGDSSGSSSLSFDFCPNNLAGMNADRKSVEDNYFVLPFTDASGNVRMGVSPQQDGQIAYLPGSRVFVKPNVTTSLFVSNISTMQKFQRSIFAPTQDEKIYFSVNVPEKANIFDGKINVYSLRGEVVSSVQKQTWSAPTTSSTNVVYSWDGKTLNGGYAKMGTYMVFFSGTTEDGQVWNSQSLCTVIR